MKIIFRKSLLLKYNKSKVVYVSPVIGQLIVQPREFHCRPCLDKSTPEWRRVCTILRHYCKPKGSTKRLTGFRREYPFLRHLSNVGRVMTRGVFFAHMLLCCHSSFGVSSHICSDIKRNLSDRIALSMAITLPSIA